MWGGPYWARRDRPYVRRHHCKRRLTGRPVVQKGVEPAGHVIEETPEPIEGVLTSARRRQITRPFLQIAPQNTRRDKPAIEQRTEPCAQPSLAELRKHECHVVVLPRVRPRDSKRAIECLLHKTRHL